MNRIKEFRLAKGLTQKRLGEMVGLAESTISLYEKGRHEPDMQTLGKFADILETTVDDLIGRSSEPATQPDGLTKITRQYTQLDDAGKRLVSELVERLSKGN